MQIIGIDIGSSSVKVSILDGDTGKLVASALAPDTEMKIKALKSGWAEQDPECWYQNLKIALQKCLQSDSVSHDGIKAIGISYQMHGLVAVDKTMKPVRPSIIWCDSRAVEIGDLAFKGLGEDYCQSNLLNSPGNFTASKLAWHKVNEPGNYEKIYKIMLPGDYIAMKLTGEIRTTVSGLSEGIFWDFKKGA
ncbi:MAG: carbohydrate kinase, partial [Bacteroidales bacterium]|nr:carbohydrate kinase [Bacteroidales bacterium]